MLQLYLERQIENRRDKLYLDDASLMKYLPDTLHAGDRFYIFRLLQYRARVHWYEQGLREASLADLCLTTVLQ